MKPLPFLVFLISATLAAQEPDSTSALFSMRETERNFARASVTYGRRAAFTEYLAEKSVIFTDKWITNGKQFSKESKAAPVVLKWEPEFMDISASRDFGVSTGPWEVQEYRPNTKPLNTGYFLTVWKKQADGAWKVILDGGSATPVNKNTLHTFSFPEGADRVFPDPPVMDAGSVSAGLTGAEKEFIKDLSSNPAPSSWSHFIAAHARIHLNGHFPTTNRDTINKWYAYFGQKLTWKPVGADVATSGDMGFTYGLLEVTGDKEMKRGHYVRIWKKQEASGWQIILEMLNTN